ncbi:hypothetical protein ARMSODRAFT_671832 [Armillaria solidipes]|uniref:Uncharacterized protein n=1 Tax=Armillaria solidipes TaxID=1076256 RepID=A0A2H3AWU8_9AGAR|nr:hypothetical protein ARMSODRAFT_671832 [Armillaria solidipes]
MLLQISNGVVTRRLQGLEDHSMKIRLQQKPVLCPLVSSCWPPRLHRSHVLGRVPLGK